MQSEHMKEIILLYRASDKGKVARSFSATESFSEFR